MVMTAKRVIYKKNPLIEVIIQYRFPKILALNEKDPIDFQDSIKEDYPFYQLTLENQQEISFSINKNNAAAPIPSIIQRQPVRNHTFISRNGKYKVNLTNEFISLSTVSYHRWEDMLSHFEKPLKAFEEIYTPPFYERIGLRYIDAFSRNELNLNDTQWIELINPVWLGALSRISEESVINSGLDIEYLLDQKNARVKIHTGLGSINKNPEQVFIVDSDFIKIDMIKLADGYNVLGYLHDKARAFISEVITEKLHVAMEPEIVE